MKKLLIILTILTCSANAYGALTYGADNYKKHLSSVLSGRGNDPIYNHMAEVDALILGGDVGSGTIYYVDSAVDASTGVTWATAVGTLQEGVNLCTANLGDFVYVGENHAEDINDADALNLDCEGITIVCFGKGENQPTISLITDAGAEMTISEADITIYNMRILGAFTNGVTNGVVINGDGDGTRILGCEFWETSNTMEQLTMISVAADADGLVIVGNRFIGGSSSDPCSAIYCIGGSDKTVIAQNTFIGSWSSNVIDALQAASTGLMITDNFIINLDATAGKTIQVNTGTGGAMIGNKCYANGAGFQLVGDAMFISPDNVAMNTEDIETRNYESMFGPFTGATGGAQGTTVHADMVLAQSDLDALLVLGALSDANTSFVGMLGYDDNDNAYASENVAANADGSILERLEQIDVDTSDVAAVLVDTGTTLPATLTGITNAIASIDETGFAGTCTSNPANTSQAACTTLADFGDDYFNTGWSLVWIYNTSSPGQYEGETQDIVDYDSGTGLFTLNTAASEQITTGDCIWIRKDEELNKDDPTMLGGAGQILYVDSVAGATGDGSGRTWENAFATVAGAEADCNAGDIVYIADGHDEDIGDILMNVANLSFIGMGEGDARPLLTSDDSTDEITLDAASITLKNLRMQPGADKCTYAIRVEDAGIGCTIENVSFITAEDSAEEFEICIDVDESASKLTVKNCTYYNTNATAADVDTFIDLTETTIDSTSIIGCRVFGTFAVAPISSGAAIPVNLSIIDNIISNTTASAYAIYCAGAATGVCVNNRLYSDDYATMLDPGSLICMGNIGTDTINEQGIRVPLSAATDDVTAAGDGSNLERLEVIQVLLALSDANTTIPGMLGYDDSDNAYSSDDVADNNDGSILERLEHIQVCLDQRDSNSSVWGVLGWNDADNGYSSDTVADQNDGSILERLESIYVKVDDSDSNNSFWGAVGIGSDSDHTYSSDDVADNNDGTVFERLEHLQTCVDQRDANTSVWGILGYDDNDNVYSSDTVVANADGSILERLEQIQTLTALLDVNTTLAGAVGYDDADNSYSSDDVVANDNGSLLERDESLQVDADAILVLVGLSDANTSLVGMLGYNDADNAYSSDNCVANDNGSLLERDESLQVDADALLVLVALSDANTSLVGMLGYDDNDNAYASENVAANGDGSILERLEQIQTLAALSDANTSFVGMLGYNDADNAYSSDTVADNNDGSMLERLESIRVALDDTDSNSSLWGAVGIGSDNNHTYSSDDVIDNNDGSIFERLEAIYAKVDDSDANASLWGAVGIGSDADHTYSSDNVADNNDGTVFERLEHIQYDSTNNGTQIVIVADVNAQDLVNNTAGATSDITTAAVGDLWLEQITLQQDSRDLSGSAWAVFEISANFRHGPNGVDLPIVTEAKASFTGNVQLGEAEFDTEALPIIMESGDTLYCHGSSAAGDVDGVIRIAMVFRRITANAQITALDIGTIP